MEQEQKRYITTDGKELCAKTQANKEAATAMKQSWIRRALERTKPEENSQQFNTRNRKMIVNYEKAVKYLVEVHRNRLQDDRNFLEDELNKHIGDCGVNIVTYNEETDQLEVDWDRVQGAGVRVSVSAIMWYKKELNRISEFGLE
jgi:hypothetical protein